MGRRDDRIPGSSVGARDRDSKPDRKRAERMPRAAGDREPDAADAKHSHDRATSRDRGQLLAADVVVSRDCGLLGRIEVAPGGRVAVRRKIPDHLAEERPGVLLSRRSLGCRVHHERNAGQPRGEVTCEHGRNNRRQDSLVLSDVCRIFVSALVSQLLRSVFTGAGPCEGRFGQPQCCVSDWPR